MNLVPWRRRVPALSMLTNLDELWNRMLGGDDDGLGDHLPEAFRTALLPPVNLAEDEHGYTVAMDCPGLEEEDFRVEVLNGQLVISGERRWEGKEDEAKYRRVESQYGHFARTLRLPGDAALDPERIDATYDKGVLTVKVPRTEAAATRRIPVHSN